MFREINIDELSMNPYTMFSDEWAALSEGNENDGYNAMTIAWGTIGALWEKYSHNNRLPIITVYVRSGRYTKEMLDRHDTFSVAFLGKENRKILGYLGSHSGRREDKYIYAGITPIFDENTVYPSESRLVFICKKVYQNPILEEGFLDKELIDFNYPNHDFHEMYVGRIEKVLVRED